MAEYQLLPDNITGPNTTVLRIADQAYIPDDPANTDRIVYNEWLADGGVPDPAIVTPPPPVVLSADQRIDAGVAAAFGTAEAAFNAINAIPHSGPIPARYEALLTQTKVLAASYLALLGALYDIYPEE